jgi:replicative DNA helicase
MSDLIPGDERPIQRLLDRIAHGVATGRAPDTVPTGFASLDKVLAGGFRAGDLVLLAGEVGSGKSALALAIALRVARLGYPVAYLSAEMSEERLLERVVALEARVAVDELRLGRLDAAAQARVRAAALGLREVPLAPRTWTERLSAAESLLLGLQPRLVVVDALERIDGGSTVAEAAEELAVVARQCKALALSRDATVLGVVTVPGLAPDRPDPRPTLDDLGGRGALKQVADVVLALYREEMYRPDSGVAGAAELLVRKNRNGGTGFVDLYFYAKWLRFEDMLDPEP